MAKPNARKGVGDVRALLQGTQSLVLNNQLMMYGVIDSTLDPYGEVGIVRAIDVMASLAELGDQSTIVVRMNSPGGSVIEGLAIYNALKAAGKPIEMHIDAMAASAASVIAMAGTDIVMAENATIMIHDPWSIAMGGSGDMRDAADEIDRQKAIILNIYAQRSGQDPDAIAAMMTAETFMSASDAVANGFADRIDQPMAVAACKALDPNTLARFLAPVTHRADARNQALVAAPPKDTTMTIPAESGSKGGKKPIVEVHMHAQPNPPASVADAVDQNAIRAEATRAERERVHGISHAVRAAKLDHGFADEMIRAGTSLADCRAQIIDKWAEQQDSRTDNPAGGQGPSGATVTKDAQDKWAEGATQGLMMRAGLVKADRSNEFTGMTLLELARSSLDVRNQRTGGMNRMDMVGRAFTVRAEGPGFNSTSDFPSILQNVAYKAMMKGYTEVEETFEQWTGKGTLTDFRPAYRVDTGLFPSLDKVDEGAEYKYGTVTDSGTMVVLATYGKMFAITRQAIINDDLHYFNQMPLKMGRAAKRTIGNLVYAILNTNPVMQDGQPLFSAAHTNLGSPGSAPSPVSIGAARALMARQKDDAGIGTGVGIRPAFMLVAPEIFDATTTVLKADYIGQDAGLQPNYVKNAATPISDGRLNGNSWFLAADPSVTDTIEVDYLDGVEEPFMDQRQGWSVDGAEYKVRIDAGVKALHWRGLYRNNGAGG